MADILEKPLLCSGDIYLADPGFAAGIDRRGPIETDSFTITPEVERIEQSSKANATYGAVRSSIVLPGTTTLELTFMDLPAMVWALLLLGLESTLTQGSGSVTDEAVTGVLDRWVDLQYANIDAASVVVQPSGGGTTWVEGTDYEINYRRGWFKALTANCVGAMDVDYDYSARSGSQVSIATESQIIHRLQFDGINKHDNKRVYLDAYQVRLAPTQAVDLKANEHASGGVSGVMEKPAGALAPGVLELDD